jgi:hypothetical protein
MSGQLSGMRAVDRWIGYANSLGISSSSEIWNHDFECIIRCIIYYATTTRQSATTEKELVVVSPPQQQVMVIDSK